MLRKLSHGIGHRLMRLAYIISICIAPPELTTPQEVSKTTTQLAPANTTTLQLPSTGNTTNKEISYLATRSTSNRLASRCFRSMQDCPPSPFVSPIYIYIFDLLLFRKQQHVSQVRQQDPGKDRTNAVNGALSSILRHHRIPSPWPVPRRFLVTTLRAGTLPSPSITFSGARRRSTRLVTTHGTKTHRAAGV